MRQPANPGAEDLNRIYEQGCAFARSGDFDAAEPLLRRAWQGLPGHRRVTADLAQVLMRRGAVEDATDLAKAQLARNPGDSFALALAAVTAVELGKQEEAHRLMDFQRLVHAIAIPVPDGYEDMAAFNKALSTAVLGRDDLERNKADRTTLGGFQSGALFPAKAGPLASLQTALAAAANDYTTRLPHDLSHPFLAQRPARVRLHGWATVLETGGHQQPHIHPSGWLSGVYYAQLPGIDQAASGDRAGHLTFGEPSSGFFPKAQHPTYGVAPKEGHAVLFPSYMHHRTEPFAGSQARISLAFDLVPRRSAAS
ncbi:MAG: tetratricopeptide repeat protein [Pseudomonadota bacterium]